MTDFPLLYSFRRCPYAMRARMGLVCAGVQCHVHEVVLRDKPPHMLAISPKGTVPVLQVTKDSVIDESLDIMRWALSQNDPEGLLQCDMREALALVNDNDGEFKRALDRYKYPNRYPEEDCTGARRQGGLFLQKLETRLKENKNLLSDWQTLADIAIFPFIRQFANVDRAWFDACDLPYLQKWLAAKLEGALFSQIMQKHKEERYLLLS